MSTILKALRRLEHDRNRGVQRPLREEVVSGPEPKRRFPVLLAVLGLFAAGLAIGALALFLWPGSLPMAPAETEPATSAQSPPTAAKSHRPAAEGPPATGPPRRAARAPVVHRVVPGQPTPGPTGPASASVPSELADAAAASEVAVVRPIEPPALTVSEGDAAEAPRPPRRGEIRPGAEALKPKSQRMARAAPRAPEATPPAVPKPQAAPPPAPAVPEPRAEPPPPTPDPSSSPSSPPSAPSEVPVILVSRTHWHPRPERREALIEVGEDDAATERRVREGDEVGPFVVQTIEPSGVVFRYEGVELRHALGSEP